MKIQYILTIIFIHVIVLPCLGQEKRQVRELQCCTMEQYPSVTKDRTRKEASYGFSGIGIDYLQSLEKLSFITFKCKPNIINFSDKLGFTDFVKGMNDCVVGNGTLHPEVCQCELGTGGWAHNEERYGLVEFLEPFIQDNMQAITHVSNTNMHLDGSFFLKAFGFWVWMTIFFLIVIFTILKLIDVKFEPIQDTIRLASLSRWNRFRAHFYLKTRRLRSALMSVAETLVGTSIRRYDRDSRTMRSWALNFLIALCGIFFILTYEAGMVAKLVQEGLVSNFNSIEDFKTGKIPPHEVCLYGRGATAAFWNRTIAVSLSDNKPNLSIVSPNQESPFMAQTFPDFTTAVHNVANRVDGCNYLFGDGMNALEALSREYCGKLVQVGDKFFPGRQGFIAPLNMEQKYIDEINRGTLHLAERNMIKSLDQYAKMKGNCELEIDSTINWGQLQIFFISVFIACALLFIHMFLNPQNTEDNAPGSGSHDSIESNSDDRDIEYGLDEKIDV